MPRSKGSDLKDVQKTPDLTKDIEFFIHDMHSQGPASVYLGVYSNQEE